MTNMNNYFRAFFLLCVLLICIFFKKDIQSEYTIPICPSSAFATNLYHDGFNDIILGHEVGWGSPCKAITLMKNIYFGTFEITDTSKSICGRQDNIFAVDVNNDGWSDLVAFSKDFSTGNAINYIRIYYNENGNFPNNNFTDFNLNNSAIFTGINYGDINGDGYIDLVVSSNNWNFWGVLYNNGNGGYSSPIYYTTITPHSIVCGDINGDGRDDVVVCGEDTQIYFSYPSSLQLLTLDTFGQMDGPVIIDFNLDGEKDILTEKYVWLSNYTILRMFKNLGNNNFQKLSEITYVGAAGGLRVADFNNDGYPDVLFAKVGGDVIWYNQGNFQLADSQYVAIPDYGETRCNVYISDMDNNSFNDIITVRFNPTQNNINLDIRFNDGNGHFLPDPIVGISSSTNVSLKFKNYPNPFKDETEFTFDLRETSQTELSVFDLQGNFVNCIINQTQTGGSHSIKWHGLDKFSRPCKPGAYIAYLKVNGKIYRTIKIIKT
jgi:hypothetical protein